MFLRVRHFAALAGERCVAMRSPPAARVRSPADPRGIGTDLASCRLQTGASLGSKTALIEHRSCS